MIVKKLSFITNYNNKLYCNKFIHLDFPPPLDIDIDELNKTTFHISTKDNSHPPVTCKLTLISLLDMSKPIPQEFTYTSHAMTEGEFVDFMINRDKDKYFNTQYLAVYHYDKIQTGLVNSKLKSFKY